MVSPSMSTLPRESLIVPKTLLDVVLSNSKFISRSGTLEHHSSDHQLMYVVRSLRGDLLGILTKVYLEISF